VAEEPLPHSHLLQLSAAYLVNGHTYEFKLAAIGSGGAPDSSTTTLPALDRQHPRRGTLGIDRGGRQ